MLRTAPALDHPAHIELLFEDGVPVAVNGISMALPELAESLSTIAADHGVGLTGPSAAQTPADIVLNHAKAALGSGVTAARAAVVRMKLHLGEHTVLSVSPGDPSRS